MSRRAMVSTAPKPKLVCLGCGCTDDRACPGGCHWSQPGICSTCEPRTKELLTDSPRARDLVVRAATGAVRQRRRSFRVMSLALVAWAVNEGPDHHAEHIEAGRSLKPFTTVRIGKTGWSFSLVYSAKKGTDEFTYTMRWRIQYPEKRRAT